ncbi:hypothetical protein BBJ28_00018333 [Nothophytophthora sp. Chile5]|nr:hypothetical protein BBJ28_00018333 [Nothophytophthora sp. Chile5]
MSCEWSHFLQEAKKRPHVFEEEPSELLGSGSIAASWKTATARRRPPADAMAEVSYYETLNIEKTATDDEIKRAYRKLAIRFHPEFACCLCLRLTVKAYSVLSDEDKRRQYDRFGKAAVNGSASGGGGGGPGMHNFQGQDAEEIFRTFFGGQDPFSMFFQDGMRGGGGMHNFGGSRVHVSQFGPGFSFTSFGGGPGMPGMRMHRVNQRQRYVCVEHIKRKRLRLGTRNAHAICACEWLLTAASYLAALVASQKKEKAARAVGKASSGKGKGKAPSGKGKAHAKPTAPPKPKKLTAKQQAAADKKAAKEAAEARAVAERAARATAKQVATVEAELRGDEEVRQARARLDAKEEEMEKKREEKKAETERRRQEKKAAEKARKQATNAATPSPKKKRRTSPHDAADVDGTSSAVASEDELTERYGDCYSVTYYMLLMLTLIMLCLCACFP